MDINDFSFSYKGNWIAVNGICKGEMTIQLMTRVSSTRQIAPTYVSCERDPETAVEPSQTLDLHQFHRGTKRSDVFPIRRDLSAGFYDFGGHSDEASHLCGIR